MEMTPKRWDFTNAYLREVFGAQDEQLRTLMPRAIAAGVPDIAVSADVGRLLKIRASITNGGRGARRIIDVGALAGCCWQITCSGPDGGSTTLPAPARPGTPRIDSTVWSHPTRALSRWRSRLARAF